MKIMKDKGRTANLIIILLSLFFLGQALTLNFPDIQQNFLFADEAIYYSMTQSLAHDFDIEYTKRDLIRYYEDIDSGPMGIFLKKGKQNKIFFAKSFLYPLCAAPFYRLFGPNGFFVFHALLLFAVLSMGTHLLKLHHTPSLSLLLSGTFIFASAAIIYYYWISPDFFNFFLVFSALFLWMYKLKVPPDSARKDSIGTTPFLLSDASDYTAGILVAAAIYAKPPNIVLLLPLIGLPLFQKKFKKAAALFLIAGAVSLIFWGANALVTGEWNYQGGERKIFHYRYPFEKADKTFDNLGQEMSASGYGEKHMMPPRIAAFNLFYYFAGRYTGIIWYFFPAFLALLVFLLSRKRVRHWLLFAALAAQIGIYIIMMPDNYAGGGGALANRYFLSIYPLFFFLSGFEKKTRDAVLSWGAAALLIAPLLISPLHHSRFPSTHAKKIPFTLFPPEMTLINNLPTDTVPSAKMVQTGNAPYFGYIHHLDDNYIAKPRGTEAKSSPPEKGIWTKGARRAEMILETRFPVKEIHMTVRNNARRTNTIRITLGKDRQTLTFNSNEKKTFTVRPGRGFRLRDQYLYRFSVTPQKSSIPFYEQTGSEDQRHLGAYFELEFIPVELKKHQPAGRVGKSQQDNVAFPQNDRRT